MFYMRLSATIPTVSTHKQQLFWILVMQFLCIFTGEFNHLQRFNRFRLVVSLIMNHPRGHQQLGKMHQRAGSILWGVSILGYTSRWSHWISLLPQFLFVRQLSSKPSIVTFWNMNYQLDPFHPRFSYLWILTHYTPTFITQIFVFKKKMFILMPRKKGSHTAIDIYCLFYFIF